MIRRTVATIAAFLAMATPAAALTFPQARQDTRRFLRVLAPRAQYAEPCVRVSAREVDCVLLSHEAIGPDPAQRGGSWYEYVWVRHTPRGDECSFDGAFWRGCDSLNRVR